MRSDIKEETISTSSLNQNLTPIFDKYNFDTCFSTSPSWKVLTTNRSYFLSCSVNSKLLLSQKSILLNVIHFKLESLFTRWLFYIKEEQLHDCINGMAQVSKYLVSKEHNQTADFWLDITFLFEGKRLFVLLYRRSNS